MLFFQDESDEDGGGDPRSSIDDEAITSEEQRDFRQQRRSERMKAAMLTKEADSHRLVIEVRPTYLIPDTNTFIDHKTTLAAIIESNKFIVLVPTVGQLYHTSSHFSKVPAVKSLSRRNLSSTPPKRC